MSVIAKVNVLNNLKQIFRESVPKPGSLFFCTGVFDFSPKFLNFGSKSLIFDHSSRYCIDCGILESDLGYPKLSMIFLKLKAHFYIGASQYLSEKTLKMGGAKFGAKI